MLRGIVEIHQHRQEAARAEPQPPELNPGPQAAIERIRQARREAAGVDIDAILLNLGGC
jgi:hypothetical protein